ncbi:MAG: signal peptidase I, partial [Clostridia bacterium]|nr:signal peptidase I [Clostridia bacterium]
AGEFQHALDVLTDLDELNGLIAEQRALAYALLPASYTPTLVKTPTKPAKGNGARYAKRGKKGKVLSNTLFCSVLIALVVVALTYRMGGNGKRNLGGYSMFNVVTDSMQSVIPKGSLVITRYTDPREIEVNDDITFLLSEKTSVTHRVVEIIEDFNETEQRGFLTMGVDSDMHDRDPVYAQNVAGRVVWHAPRLGAALVGIGEHWQFVAYPLAGISILILVLKYLMRQKRNSIIREAKISRSRPAPSPADTLVIFR